MIALTLDLSKVDKERIFVSPKTGKKYLNFVLLDAPDQYGNAGQVHHSVTKEEPRRRRYGRALRQLALLRQD